MVGRGARKRAAVVASLVALAAATCDTACTTSALLGRNDTLPRKGPIGTSAVARDPAQRRDTGARPVIGRSGAGDGSADVPGTPWRIPARLSGGISGYANHVSAAPGQPVKLYVSTPAPRFRVRAIRMGWYQGMEGRAVWLSGYARGGTQAAARVLSASTHTMTASWHPSMTVSTAGWQPGAYLLRLEASTGHMAFIPLTVRAASAQGKVVLVDAVTTWQAYNSWGCCDLYAGSDGSFDSRSRAVTFDRPYLNEDGAGQFIRDELGVVAEAERLDLPLDYITDVDLDQNCHILDGARAVVSMGHDEYWSRAMRAVVTAARDHGTNLAFFGANAIFRRIRFAPTAIGPDRLEINYKVAAEDPLNGRDNPQVTADWPAPPAADPESSLLGDQYGCYFGLVTHVSGVVTDPDNWMYAGAHVTFGERLPGLIGPEIDAVQPNYPTPRPIQIIMRSPAACPGGMPPDADASYYTSRSGAAIFDAGTIAWDHEVGPTCTNASNPVTHEVVRQVTDNILRTFAEGPAGQRHPA